MSLSLFVLGGHGGQFGSQPGKKPCFVFLLATYQLGKSVENHFNLERDSETNIWSLNSRAKQEAQRALMVT